MDSLSCRAASVGRVRRRFFVHRHGTSGQDAHNSRCSHPARHTGEREDRIPVQSSLRPVESYGVTSYLGDVLSYSRLLALGLATSAVGVIINMLAGLAGDIPFIGWILALLLIIGGHIFSIAVNVLGAFVHSLSLQYVEFFSKFYTGGGRVFAPLTYKTSYVSIKKEPVE